MTSMTPADTETLEFRGGWLIAARVIWIAITLVLIAGVIYALGPYFEQLHTLTGAALSFDFGIEWTTESLRAALAATGISVRAFGTVMSIAALLPKVVFLSVALIIFVRSSHQWMGWYTALMLILLGLAFGAITSAPAESSVFWDEFIEGYVNLVAWISFYTFLYIFPGGRLAPRWMWVAVAINVGILPLVIELSDFSSSQITPFLVVYLFGSGVYSQVYRYRHISGPVERLQTRWLITSAAVLGTAIVLAGFVLPSAIPVLDEPGPIKLYYHTGRTLLWAVTLSLVPIALGFAILRYRLWDIDLIIRRTLIYGLITAVLALVYFGGVIVLQSLFSGITGGESPLAIVATTLLIAALFAPLRKRVQDFVDRRFYRRKYDLTRTVDEFAATLYEAVDIEHLSGSLVRVVDKTMKPHHVSLWVNEPTASGQEERAR